MKRKNKIKVNEHKTIESQPKNEKKTTEKSK